MANKNKCAEERRICLDLLVLLMCINNITANLRLIFQSDLKYRFFSHTVKFDSLQTCVHIGTNNFISFNNKMHIFQNQKLRFETCCYATIIHFQNKRNTRSVNYFRLNMDVFTTLCWEKKINDLKNKREPFNVFNIFRSNLDHIRVHWIDFNEYIYRPNWKITQTTDKQIVFTKLFSMVIWAYSNISGRLIQTI